MRDDENRKFSLAQSMFLIFWLYFFSLDIGVFVPRPPNTFFYVSIKRALAGGQEVIGNLSSN